MSVPDLDRLVAHVEAATEPDAPLDRLALAASLRDELSETAEALLDHFVGEARQAGHSWAQVGDALGVSKQAVHQRAAAPTTIVRSLLSRVPRFSISEGGGPFGRTSCATRDVALRARALAMEADHPQIGTGHLLFGLVAVAQGIATEALSDVGVTEPLVRAKLSQRIKTTSTDDDLAFSPRASKVMELALREALRLKSPKIQPEHALLGLLRERAGTASDILRDLGVDGRSLRDDVEQRIASGSS